MAAEGTEELSVVQPNADQEDYHLMFGGRNVSLPHEVASQAMAT